MIVLVNCIMLVNIKSLSQHLSCTDTDTVSGMGIQHFLKTYVGQYGYQVSGTIQVRVSDTGM